MTTSLIAFLKASTAYREKEAQREAKRKALVGDWQPDTSEYVTLTDLQPARTAFRAAASRIEPELTALIADMKVMAEALKFYADSKNYLSADSAGEYEEPFKGLMGDPQGVVMTIMDAAGEDGGAKAREALTRAAHRRDLWEVV